MADEFMEEGEEPLDDDSESPDSEKSQENLEENVFEDLGTDVVADDNLGKSPEEFAAEQAMLAELEKSMAGDMDDESTSALPIASQNADAEPVAVMGGPNLDLLMDVNLLITVELGRKEMRFAEVLQLGKGSLVELSKIADEPVDIYVNQSKIAEGEVVVVEDHFGVRITRLLNTEKIKRFA